MSQSKRVARSPNVPDLRNDLALARDAWLESAEGDSCSDGTASGYYLRNRLMAAFVAGWRAREAKRRG